MTSEPSPILDGVSETSSGVAILVWRRDPELEVLLLHRRRFGGSFEGDWAWTTPGGGREQGEQPAATAARETGLRLRIVPVSSRIAAEQPGINVDLFTAEASVDDRVCLSDEHDRFEWVKPGELDRCLPTWVAEMYWESLETLPSR